VICPPRSADRLAVHLDLGDDLQQPPVHTSTAKTRTRPMPYPEAAASIPGTTRTPLGNQMLPVSASNCRRHHEDD
jgi:hypothetical protein